MDQDKFNRVGMTMFVVAFIVAPLFFLYILFIKNAGPIDEKAKITAKGMSHEEIVAREKEFRTSSAESITFGKEIYASKCTFCHTQNGQDAVIPRYASKSWKFGIKETDIYHIIYRGIPGPTPTSPVMARMNFMLPRERWALVHYLRSLASGAPSSTSADWDALDREPIY